MNSLPNFLIVGSQKCGTTTLHDILSRHPQANMSAIKEIIFFIHQSKYARGLDYYKTFWNLNKEYKVIGESSPGYMVYPGAAETIRKDLGEIKIIIILRDPIRRALSQYWDNRWHLSETETFEQTIDKYLSDTYSPSSKGYFSRGVYIRYIKKYWELFGKDHVHIMVLEQLISQPQLELRNLYNFLKIDDAPEYLVLPKASNRSVVWTNPIYKLFFNNPNLTNYLPKRGRSLLFYGRKKPYKYALPNPKVIRSLIHFYTPWNQELRKQTGLNTSSWIS